MPTSRSDRNRSSTSSVSEQVFWEEIDKLTKKLNQLKPRVAVSPQIVGQPQPVSVATGRDAQFYVIATGETPLAYQWFKNGVIIQGAIGQTLTVSNVQSADDGNVFSVRVTNRVGSSMSQEAGLTVTIPPDNMPLNGIIMWHGLLADIPTNYQLCDGTNGTPDLLDKFVMGVPDGATDPGDTGGSDTHGHGIGTLAANKTTGLATLGAGSTVVTDVSVIGAPADATTLPPYYKVAFIMRMS